MVLAEEDAIKETLNEVNFKDLITAFSSMMKEFGSFSRELAKIEKEKKDVFIALKKITSDPDVFIKEIIEKADPEKVGLFLKLMLRMRMVEPKLNNLMNISVEEKEKLAEDLDKLAKDLEGLISDNNV